jgi:hypothetical protein
MGDAHFSKAVIARRTHDLGRCVYFSAAAGRSMGTAISSEQVGVPPLGAEDHRMDIPASEPARAKLSATFTSMNASLYQRRSIRSSHSNRYPPSTPGRSDQGDGYRPRHMFSGTLERLGLCDIAALLLAIGTASRSITPSKPELREA